jgi:hypothetical protein
MREILPGLHHWTAFHERIRLDVSSYYAAGSRALIDPMVPADGIEALELDAICPDDTALHLDAGEGALAFADGLVHWGDGTVGFVPDQYMDGPEQVKRTIRDVAAHLLEEQRFSTLLFAHGDPIVGDGEAALRAFVRT